MHTYSNSIINRHEYILMYIDMYTYPTTHTNCNYVGVHPHQLGDRHVDFVLTSGFSMVPSHYSPSTPVLQCYTTTVESPVKDTTNT